jgi:hypothetical protein
MQSDIMHVELGFDPRQWLVGANYHEGCGLQFFFLCFRLGIQPGEPF